MERDQIDRTKIDRIKVLHRPDVHWRNCVVFAGCSCGTPYHPCDKLLVALEIERQMSALARNAGQRYRRP